MDTEIMVGGNMRAKDFLFGRVISRISSSICHYLPCLLILREKSICWTLSIG